MSVVNQQGFWSEVWRERMDMNITQVRHALFRWQSGQVTSGAQAVSLQDQTHEILIQASLDRFDGALDLARHRWQEALRISAGARLQDLEGRLWSEAGLNEMAAQQFAQALGHFLKARGFFERASASFAATTMNAVLCAEYLGIELKDVQADLSELWQAPVPPSSPGLRSQYLAWQSRQSWNSANAAHLTKEISDLSRTSGTWDQHQYFLLWLASLPHFRWKSPNGVNLNSLLGVQSESFFRSYRLRTLLGQWHPDDATSFRAGDAVERLYLWTWRWFYGELESLEKIEWCLRSLGGRTIRDQVTPAEFRLYSRTLEWLRLAGVPSLPQISAPPSAGEGEWLQLEAQIQTVCRSWIRGESREIADLSAHLGVFAAASPEHPLAALLREIELLGTDAVSRSPFTRRISELRRSFERRQNAKIHFDSDGGRILHRSSGQIVNSVPLARAFELFANRGWISCAEFAEICFNQKGYEAALHDPRIFNLIARIRPLLPEGLQISKRGERLLREGNWNCVIPFEEADEGYATQSVQQTETLEGPKDSITKNSSPDVRPENLPAVFTRGELEAKLKVSKATANRLLKTWIDDGSVMLKGLGPSTKYENKSSKGNGR